MPSKEQPRSGTYKRQQCGDDAAKKISRDYLRRSMHAPPKKGNRSKNTRKCACASLAALDRALRRQTEQHAPEDGFNIVEDHVRFQGAPAS
jgi:hypothetical protein